MKKLHILIVALAVAVAGYGQTTSEKNSRSNNIEKVPSQHMFKGDGAVFYYEDFDWENQADPQGWTLPAGWELVDHDNTGFNWLWMLPDSLIASWTFEPPFRSTTAHNGFICLPLDWYNTQQGTDINVNNSIQLAPVDCSAHGSVILRFEQNFMGYSSWTMNVQVSNDLGGHWAWYDCREGAGHKERPLDAEPGEAVVFEANISNVAAGSPNVLIRIHWSGTRLYYWEIDDFSLSEAYDNDLQTGYISVEYDDKIPGNSESVFHMIPKPQLAGGGFTNFEAQVRNFGELNQTGVYLDVEVIKDQNSFFHAESPKVNLPVLITDTLYINDIFYPDNPGTYTVNMKFMQDETEDFPEDNIKTWEIHITDTVYSRSDNTSDFPFSTGKEWYNNPTDGWIDWTRYPVQEVCEVNSVSAYIQGGDNALDFRFVIYMFDPGAGTVGPDHVEIVASDMVDLDSSMFNTWVTLPINKDGRSEFLMAGNIYYAAIQYWFNTNDLMARRNRNLIIGNDRNIRIRDYVSGVCTDGESWHDYPQHNFMIRMNVYDNFMWKVDPSDFRFDGDITAEVFIDDVPITNGGILAAFAGDQCRGIQKTAMTGPTGKYVFIVRCYSNVANGEILSFKFYDADNNKIYDIEEKVEFESNMILGNALDPYPLNIYSRTDISLNLSQGWNWFSINVFDFDMTITNVLASLPAIQGNYVKNHTESSTYYDNDGWIGGLTDLNTTEMYKIKLRQQGQINHRGRPCDPANTAVEVSAGWNWIGYPAQRSVPLSDALSTLNIQDLDYIKDQVNSSTYYEGYGWFGDLVSIEPFGGYMLRAAQQGTIIYPDPGQELPVIKSENITESYPDNQLFLFNPQSFEFNGSLTAEVLINEKNSGAEENILYAYVGNENRGKAKGKLFPPTDKFVYNLMMHSNTTSGEEITFRFFDKDENRWYEFEEKLKFNSDMVEADAINPFILKNGSIMDTGWMTDKEFGFEVYPNPFNGFLNIRFMNPEHQKVHIAIYDGYGRKVGVIEEKTYQTGEYKIEWNGKRLPKGIYFIRMETNSYVGNQKVVKLN